MISFAIRGGCRGRAALFVLLIIYNRPQQTIEFNTTSTTYQPTIIIMVQEKHEVTEHIISEIKSFAESEEGRQLHPNIPDSNSRAYYILNPYQSKYKKLTTKFTALQPAYKKRKVQQQYNKYYKTALRHFEEAALASDPTFVPPEPPAPASRRRTTRTAPTTTAPATTSAPTSSTEAHLLLQSMNKLGQTFVERDAHTAQEMLKMRNDFAEDMANRDAKKDEEMLQMRKEQADRDAKYQKEQADRDAKRAEEDKEYRQEMSQMRKDMADRDEKRAEENKTTRDMAVFAIAEVATAKKDIATAKKEREEIRQYIGMDDVKKANLFQDGKYI